MKKIILFALFAFISHAITAQEYLFSVHQSGSGKQSVIFVPGFACSGDVWQETAEALGEAYTCYRLTMPGFAGVEPEENPSFESWVEQLSCFIRNEDIRNPILVGHSMGGGLALAVAADNPRLVQKVVVVDALPCLMALTNPAFTPATPPDCSAIVRRFTEMNDEQFARMQRMSAAGLTTDTSKLDVIVEWGLRSDRKTYAQLYCDYSNTDIRQRIKHITAPVLVLLEPQFRNVQAEIEEQYKNLSGVQLAYAGKGLHFIMYDDREWLMNRIHAFLNDNK